VVPFVGYARPMPKAYQPRRIAAENLKKMMESAKQRGYAFGTIDGLAAATGLGRMTVVRYRSEGPAKIEELETLARAFGPKFHAWHLLMPGLDISNPPVALVHSPEEQRKRSIFERALALMANDDEQGNEGGEVGAPGSVLRDRSSADGLPARPKQARKRRSKA
jgi:hypothetical protein